MMKFHPSKGDQHVGIFPYFIFCTYTLVLQPKLRHLHMGFLPNGRLRSTAESPSVGSAASRSIWPTSAGVLVVVLMISVFFFRSKPGFINVHHLLMIGMYHFFLDRSLYTVYIPNIEEQLTQILLVLSSKPSLCLNSSFNWINPACCRYFPSIFFGCASQLLLDMWSLSDRAPTSPLSTWPLAEGNRYEKLPTSDVNSTSDVTTIQPC